VKRAGRSRAGALCLLALAAHAGCAVTGTYEPRPSPRISKLDPTGRVYVRDGRRFELGLAGSAEDLVRGNELAVEHARRYRRRQTAALAVYGLGLASFGTGLGLLVPPRRSDGRFVAGNVLFLASSVSMIVAAVFFSSAIGNLEDAVNIYNDALEGPIVQDQPVPGGR
jgi:hypothetical protein